MAPSEMPLDGGWGWLVVLGSFINQGFGLGGARSFGVIFVHLREYFGATSAAAAWAAALINCGLSLFCPVAGLLADRFTFRLVTMIGAAAQGLAFVMVAFGTETYFVSITMGVLNGFAVGFLHTTSIGAVSQYFARRSSLAMGAAAAGASVGQLVIPQILRYLLDNYGYSGCMLIYGGLAWNSLVASALFRPASFYSGRRRTRVKGRGVVLPKRGHPEDGTSARDECAKSERRGPAAVGEKSGSDSSEIGRESADGGVELDNATGNGGHDGEGMAADATTMESGGGPRQVKALLDPAFTRNPRFWIYAMAILLANPTVHNMVMFLPPYAKEIGLSKKQAALLLSVGGVSDLIGKICGGFLNGLQLIRTRTLMAAVLSTLCAVSLICVSLPSYGSLMLMSVLLGALGGIYTGINPICLLEITGARKFPMAFTLAVAIHASSSLATPLMAGLISDITGSYEKAYWMCLCMMASGAVLFQMDAVVTKSNLYRKRKTRTDSKTYKDDPMKNETLSTS